MHASPTCTEITVEDPSEAFDDLRDFRDYARLSQDEDFKRVIINPSIDSKFTTPRIGVRVPTAKLLDIPELERLRGKHKIAPRQFYRMVELYLFSRIPQSTRSSTGGIIQKGRTKDVNNRTYFYWRLLVKQRVYKQNKDKLIQVDRAERIDKVDMTVNEIVGDYERLLRHINEWETAEKKSKAGNGVEEGPSRSRIDRAKRKVMDDEEDDEDDEMDSSSPKRAKSEAL